MSVPAIVPPGAELTMRELSIQAANAANLNSFADAYTKDPTQYARVDASFSKHCSPLTKLANVSDSGLIQQLCFIQPNKKIAIMSCPFLAQQGPTNEVVFAGSLGDAMDTIYPVTIRMRDVRGEIISVCSSRNAADQRILPISSSNPLDEEGPPNEEVEFELVGPDRIFLDIQDDTQQPCFVAIPKIFPLPKGYTVQNSPSLSAADTSMLPNIDPTSSLNIWYQTLRYGVNHLDNHSLHSRDTLFVWEGIEKAEFTAEHRNLASRCTTIVTAVPFDDPLYQLVLDKIRSEKINAQVHFGAKTLVPRQPPATATPTQLPTTTGGPATPGFEMAALIDGFARAINKSSAEITTSTEREKAKEADAISRFYTLLFASEEVTIQEDGTSVTKVVPATINPLFVPVLSANKNSKATKAMQDAIESMSAALAHDDDRFASAANLYPRLFDQPLSAALRTGQWEHHHTVLNPDGVKSNFGIHHLAPPRTMSATYRTRQQGAILLVQQEQVEEDSSRLQAKATELYYNGRMGSPADINEMIGNFFGLMNTIIRYKRTAKPVLWTEIAKFDQLLRTPEGRQWCELHRNVREVLFNVVQDLQSIIAGFVSEARKQSYQVLVEDAIRQNLQVNILQMTAGPYKESNLLFKVFYPDPPGQRRRDPNEPTPAGSSPQARQRTGDHAGTSTPTGSPNNLGVQPLPGKTVLVHEGSPPTKQAPPSRRYFPSSDSTEQLPNHVLSKRLFRPLMPIANMHFLPFPQSTIHHSSGTQRQVKNLGGSNTPSQMAR